MWARGANEPDDLDEQLRALGLDPSAVAPAEPLEVPRSALPAVRLAAAGFGQWRWTGGMAPVPLGLDWAALAPLASALGVVLTDVVVADVTAIEQGAIEALARERSP